ncbi:MAG: hypothetical protein K2K26_02685, partial [Muribaculaceae bacterium]|nr:hypothetical protein [Muribaculaceae bacterium]
MKTFLTILSGSLLVGVLTACSSEDIPAVDDKVISGNEGVAGVNEEHAEYTVPAFPDETNRGKILSLPESAKGVPLAANAFAVDMFRTVREQSGGNNIATAPFSVFTALSMAANGDSGQTRDGIVNRLGNGEATLEEL